MIHARLGTRVVIPLLALAGAFAAGRVTAARSAASGREAPVARAAPPPVAVTLARPAPVPAPPVAMVQVAATEAPRPPSPGKDAPGWAALQKLDRTTACEQREDERLRLIEQWAATDPLSALDYVRNMMKGDRQAQAMSAVATTWAKHDPNAAWRWAGSLGPGGSNHLHTVLEEVAKNDPALATRFAAEAAKKDPPQAVALTLTAMRGMAYEGNFDAARKLAAEVPLGSADERATLYNFMGGQWARHDPEQAAHWAQSLPPGPSRDQALIGLGESWAEVDPSGAADFAAHLPPGAQRQTALRQAIANWGLADPQEASSWLKQFPPSDDFDQAVASLATQPSVMNERMDLAVRWANDIVNPQLRLTALNEVVATWSARDPAAAMNYVKTSSDLSDDARSYLLLQLLSRAAN